MGGIIARALRAARVLAPEFLEVFVEKGVSNKIPHYAGFLGNSVYGWISTVFVGPFLGPIYRLYGARVGVGSIGVFPLLRGMGIGHEQIEISKLATPVELIPT